MKKSIVRLASIILLAVMPSMASAQFINTTPAKKLLEIDAHISLGTLGITQDYGSKFPSVTEVTGDNGFGYGGGFGAVIRLREWLGFGTELNILAGRNKLNMAVSDEEAMSMSNIFVRNDYTYINVPVFMSFRFNILDGLSWNVDGGLYYSYGLTGSQKQSIYRSYVNNLGQLIPLTVISHTGYFTESSTFINSFHRSDVGLHVATGLQFGEHLVIGLRFQFGFKNISYNEGIVNPNIHNLCFMGGIGYKL